MDICLGHAVVVHLQGLELCVVFLFPFVDVPCGKVDVDSHSVFSGGRLVLNGDVDCLHLEDRRRNFSAVRSV